MRDRSTEELWQFANRFFWTVALVLAVVVIFGVIFRHMSSTPSPLLRQVEGWDEAITLNRIIFPYLFFLGLAAIGIGILNSFHSFGLPRPPASC